MIIELSDLQNEKTFRGEEPEALLDDLGRTSDIRLVAPIQYELKAVKVHGALLVTGTLTTRAEFHCSRCDRKFSREVRESQFERSWELAPGGLSWVGRLDADESEPVDEESVTGHPAARKDAAEAHASVDLTPDIREAMILCFPGYPVCKAECKGLCPTCGKNLNKGACTCAPPPDNRWSVLDRLDAR